MENDSLVGANLSPEVMPEVIPQELPKMVPQHEVNRIVGKARQDAHEKAKREFAAEAQGQMNVQNPNMGMAQMSEPELRRIMAEEARKAQMEQIEAFKSEAQNREGHRIAQEFLTQLAAGNQEYSDFDETVKSLDYSKIPNIVQLAHETGESHHVMYELAKNPGKIAQLDYLSRIDPHLATREIQLLIGSIKKNREAANIKMPKEPLSQMKPSTVGTDNGRLTISDLRKNPRYRG